MLNQIAKADSLKCIYFLDDFLFIQQGDSGIVSELFFGLVNDTLVNGRFRVLTQQKTRNYAGNGDLFNSIFRVLPKDFNGYKLWDKEIAKDSITILIDNGKIDQVQSKFKVIEID